MRFLLSQQTRRWLPMRVSQQFGPCTANNRIVSPLRQPVLMDIVVFSCMCDLRLFSDEPLPGFSSMRHSTFALAGRHALCARVGDSFQDPT